MEMMHRDDRRDDYAFISGSTHIPWYSRYKRKICGISVVLLVIGVIVILVATSRSRKSTSTDVVELYPLKWDGHCPWEPEQCPESFQGQPPLILVSLDGFRADYLERGFNPVLHKISQCGVNTEAMYSVFPTKTFPNHFTQVTGLYPSSHGIVDNTMYDSGKVFKVSSGNNKDPFWWEQEPIWVSAVKQGLKAATFFWPGSDVKINGTYPTYYKTFNSDTPFEERVDQVLAWLDLPVESRPRFLTLYFNEPDSAAHEFGTDSKEVDAALVRVDSMVERLFAGLQFRNLTGCVNVLFVSDHGMTNISCSNVVYLDTYINVSEVDSIVGAFGRLKPKDQNTSVDTLVSKLQCEDFHMRVVRKEHLPIRLHYSNHRRIEPVILDMDNGWTVLNEVNAGSYKCTGAAHGYDNMFPDMRAFFAATGPSMKKNLTIQPFLNIELYELMCELTNITANPNNGTRGSMHHLLRDPKFLLPEEEHEPPIIAELPNASESDARKAAANCECKQTRKQMNVANVTEKKNYHLPFGIPGSDENDLSLLLYNNDYILDYHTEIRMPLWASFTLDNETSLTKEKICWKGDARIAAEQNIQCTDYNSQYLKDIEVIQRPLYFAGFSDPIYKEEMEYVTNSIPKSQDHDLEDELIPSLREWTQNARLLNIVVGPAFDLLGTGIRPSAEEFRKEHERYGELIVPTHLFVIATWCSLDVGQLVDCNPSNLDTLAFILPNHPYPENWNCEAPGYVISKNVARVVDVEKLTGLSFFTGLPRYDAIRLRTKMPQLHT